MITSDKGKELIKHFESFRGKAYFDQAGVCTIGYGTTIINGRPVQPTDECDLGTALIYLSNDLRVFESAVGRLITIDLKQHQFDALVCFAYNVGEGALASSTLRKHINAGIPVEEKRFTDWNKIKINGVLTPSAGLTRRRKAEFHLFSTGQIKTSF